jgi:DNA-binding NarL/FixJ family response regulator
VRVVVADDVMLTREGIVRLLTDAGVDVVAEADDAERLLREVRLKRPDAAIVDIRMPPTHTDEGLVATQRIRSEHPEVGVLVLSQYVEPSYALRLLEEHPERVGYLLKQRVFDVAVLVDALRRIAEGETVVDPTIVARLFGRRRREDPLAELTDREREVLGLVAERPLKPRDCRPPVRHRAHRRGARQADLPQARARGERRLAPPRARRTRLRARRAAELTGHCGWPQSAPLGFSCRHGTPTVASPVSPLLGRP